MESNTTFDNTKEETDLNKSLVLQNGVLNLLFTIFILIFQFTAVVNFQERDYDAGWAWFALCIILLIANINQVIKNKSKKRKERGIEGRSNYVIKGIYWKLPLLFMGIIFSLFLMSNAIYSFMYSQYAHGAILAFLSLTIFGLNILFLKKSQLRIVL